MLLGLQFAKATVQQRNAGECQRQRIGRELTCIIAEGGRGDNIVFDEPHT